MPNHKLEHIAFILDGNKRWAKKNNINLKNAYKKGLENISELISNSLEIKLKYLTLFTLSSENIQRQSVSNIFQVIYDDFSFFFDKIIAEKKVKIKIIGSKLNLPTKILKLIDHCEYETCKNKKLILNLAFNYGFKDEIKQVLQKIKDDSSININNPKNIKELFLLGDTKDPDLLIRTGGEMRLSNFLLWNLAYTELMFVSQMWPEFDDQILDECIINYKNRKRNYGE